MKSIYFLALVATGASLGIASRLPALLTLHGPISLPILLFGACVGIALTLWLVIYGKYKEAELSYEEFVRYCPDLPVRPRDFLGMDRVLVSRTLNAMPPVSDPLVETAGALNLFKAMYKEIDNES